MVAEQTPAGDPGDAPDHRPPENLPPENRPPDGTQDQPSQLRFQPWPADTWRLEPEPTRLAPTGPRPADLDDEPDHEEDQPEAQSPEAQSPEAQSPDGWRTEADEAWLAQHSSNNFARWRRRLARLGIVGEALSNAELGPFGGARRNPELRRTDKAYAVIRYTEHQISYTTVHIDLAWCRRCGGRLEIHQVVRRSERIGEYVVGEVRGCRRCDAGSWLFESHMPRTRRARARGRYTVL